MNRLVVLFCLVWPAFGQVAGQHHPPQSAGEYARVLDDAKREEWQKPDEVIRALALRPQEVIADIGAGTGYFSKRLARQAGKVYAVDIDADLLKMAAQDAPQNMVTVLAAPDDPRLPQGGIDTVFFCDVLHHIGNRPEYYKKLARALAPGGRIVNIDFQKRQLPVGPPPSMKLSEEQVVAEFRAAGFRLAKKFDFLPYQYFLVFERKNRKTEKPGQEHNAPFCSRKFRRLNHNW